MTGGCHLRFGNVVKEAPAARILHHDAEVRVGQYAPAMPDQPRFKVWQYEAKLVNVTADKDIT